MDGLFKDILIPLTPRVYSYFALMVRILQDILFINQFEI
jgi:hypothetical protein